jgi:hypothetical protein
MAALENLKDYIRKYRDVDNEIRELNKAVYEKRDTRKSIELEITTVLSLPQFQAYDKLKIDEDGSTIRIKRPETYEKAWSLSKKELKALLDEYFKSDQPLNADSCFEFIVAQRKQALVGTEFELTRIVPNE